MNFWAPVLIHEEQPQPKLNFASDRAHTIKINKNNYKEMYTEVYRNCEAYQKG